MYRTTVHAEKAKRVPGIARFVINLAPDLSGSGREQAYDGFAEVWFEPEAAMRASARSPFSVIVQEHVMVGAE